MKAQPKSPRFPVRLAVLLGAVALLGLLFAVVDLSPDLSHLRVRMLSGPEQGGYYALVHRLAAAAAEDGGRLGNESSQGTIDNLQRLAAASDDCKYHFALVQDGVPAPDGSKLELIARLKKSESMFVLGRGASSLRRFEELRGKTVGVGPVGSGTDHLARTVFETATFSALGMRLSNHPVGEQLELLRSGALDLGVFVVDEDAPLIREAVVGGLEIAAFEHWDVIARQHMFLWHGRVGAGQFDPIAVLPASDTRVLRVDTLVVGNGCASNSQTVAMLSLLSSELPGFIEHNRERGRSELFATPSSAQSFFEAGGPGLLEQHVPWLVNIMSPSNWVYVIMCLSVVMNLMTFWHRFRLWRLDVNRDRTDDVVREILGSTYTAKEIEELAPSDEHRQEQIVHRLEDAVAAYAELRKKCQKQANSMLVPMGQEGSYRYQEDQIEDMLTAVRAFRSRIKEEMK